MEINIKMLQKKTLRLPDTVSSFWTFIYQLSWNSLLTFVSVERIVFTEKYRKPDSNVEEKTNTFTLKIETVGNIKTPIVQVPTFSKSLNDFRFRTLLKFSHMSQKPYHTGLRYENADKFCFPCIHFVSDEALEIKITAWFFVSHII